MRDGFRIDHALGPALAACLLVGCPVDDRTLESGAAAYAGERSEGEGGAAGVSVGGNSSSDAGAGGDAPASGGAEDGGGGGMVAASGAGGANGGTGGSGGTNSGATGGGGGEPPIVCSGSKCSCFEEVGDECRGESCCDAPIVAGNAFSLGDESESVSATVADHRLDRYEVTVGRFRRFLENYLGPPHPESGQHPWVVASGWRSEWDAHMPADAAAFAAALDCDPEATFREAAGESDLRPMNCVSWYEAFAFCAWDGGRLPTEAEWEYAASAGTLDRSYPWGETSPAAGIVVFDTTAPASVGAKPAGAGHYRQLDLAGSVSEWVFDWIGAYVEPCDNCARVDADVDADAERVVRGGSYLSSDPEELRANARVSEAPLSRSVTIGLRCARDL